MTPGRAAATITLVPPVAAPRRTRRCSRTCGARARRVSGARSLPAPARAEGAPRGRDQAVRGAERRGDAGARDPTGGEHDGRRSPRLGAEPGAVVEERCRNASYREALDSQADGGPRLVGPRYPPGKQAKPAPLAAVRGGVVRRLAVPVDERDVARVASAQDLGQREPVHGVAGDERGKPVRRCTAPPTAAPASKRRRRARTREPAHHHAWFTWCRGTKSVHPSEAAKSPSHCLRLCVFPTRPVSRVPPAANAASSASRLWSKPLPLGRTRRRRARAREQEEGQGHRGARPPRPCQARVPGAGRGDGRGSAKALAARTLRVLPSTHRGRGRPGRARPDRPGGVELDLALGAPPRSPAVEQAFTGSDREEAHRGRPGACTRPTRRSEPRLPQPR